MLDPQGRRELLVQMGLQAPPGCKGPLAPQALLPPLLDQLGRPAQQALLRLLPGQLGQRALREARAPQGLQVPTQLLLGLLAPPGQRAQMAPQGLLGRLLQ